MSILAIDPGTTHSGIVLWDGNRVLESHPHMLNGAVRLNLMLEWTAHRIVCEWVACYGMAVGKEVFETCRFCGRIQEICESREQPLAFITRPEVKLRLCNSARAKDPNVRQAIIDRCGGKESIKKGGPLYGVSSHAWSALAAAIAIDLT